MRLLIKILLLTVIGLSNIDTLFAQADSALTLEEVQITTGQYRAQSLNKSVYKVQVITKEKIALKGATNLTQILNTELGMGISNDNTLGTTDISFMGVAGRNVKILLDGLPMLDRGDTRESLNQFDVLQIERIEIVEGPMSTTYGTDALAGVINIITKSATPNSIHINAKLQEETVGKEYSPFAKKGLHVQNLSAAWDNNGFNGLLSLGHTDLKGFGADQYGRAHKWRPKEQWLPSLRFGYKNDKIDIYYRNDYLWERITANGPINLDTYRTIDQFYNTRRVMHQVQSNWRFNSKATLTNGLSYTNYKRFTRTIRKDLQNKTEELTTGAGEQDTAEFNNFFWRSSLQYAVSPKVSIQPGLELNHETSKGQRISGEPKITDFSFFVSTEYKPASWINIRPGLRFVKNSIYDAPPVIPSLNTLFTINDEFALRAAYALGYRAPALRELYFEFIDANHKIYGNPNLKAEKSRSFNASLVYSKLLQNNRRFTAEAGGFHNYFNNLISIGADPDDNGKNIYINIEENKTTGFSAKARIQTQNWQAGVGGIMLGRYNRFNGENFDGKNIPEFNWTPELNAEIMYTIAATRTSLNFFYRFNGKRKQYQTTDGINITLGDRDAFHYGDFSIGQYFNKFLNLTAGIRNVFNTTSVVSTQQSGGAHSAGGDYIFNYGRSYFLTLIFNYNNFKKQ